MERAAFGLASLVLLGGCGTSGEQASPPATVTQTVTVTASASSETPATKESFDPRAIRMVELDYGPHGNAVGQGKFQVNRASGSTTLPSVEWVAKGEDGDVRGYDCGVIVDVTGPGGFSERMRSDECSGTVPGMAEVSELGFYEVRVEVTPPNGDEPVVAETIFELIGYGQ